MYGREQRALLHHYLERGLSKAEVARELGFSRRTTHHWIATGQLNRELDDAPVRYGARPPIARKVDPFGAMPSLPMPTPPPEACPYTDLRTPRKEQGPSRS